MDSISVNIFGEEYNIRSNDDPAYVRKVAQYLDSKMREVAGTTKIVSSSKIAILAALNITDEYLRLKETSQSSEENINKVLTELIKVLEDGLKS